MDLPGRKSVDLLTETARDVLTVRRVFGESYTAGEVTVIPVATVMGGSGMGFGAGYRPEGTDSPGETTPDGEGGGGGFGVRAKPAGVFVVKDGSVSWQPALDINRLALGGQLLGAVALIAWALTRRR